MFLSNVVRLRLVDGFSINNATIVDWLFSVQRKKKRNKQRNNLAHFNSAAVLMCNYCQIRHFSSENVTFRRIRFYNVHFSAIYWWILDLFLRMLHHFFFLWVHSVQIWRHSEDWLFFFFLFTEFWKWDFNYNYSV